MNRGKKLASALGLLFITAFFFIVNLYKGAIPGNDDPFSLKNIITTGIFFIIVIPLLIIFKKSSRKRKK